MTIARWFPALLFASSLSAQTSKDTTHVALTRPRLNTIQSAQPPVAITPPPPSPGHPNEPPGFVQLSPTLTGDTVPPAQRDYAAGMRGEIGWIQRDRGSIQQILDTLPGRGPTKVLQITFPAGMVGGGSPGMVWTAKYPENPQFWPQHPHQIYQSWWYRISPDYPLNLVANKVHYSNIGGQNQVAVEINGSSDFAIGPNGVGAVFVAGKATQFNAAIFPALGLQGTVGIDGKSNNGQALNPNVGVPDAWPEHWADSIQIKRGRWYHFETLYIANSAGKWDGGAMLWVNGNLRIDFRNRLKWTETGEFWRWTSWTPVYGGGGSIPSGIPNAFHHLRDFYVSGKP
jgi:hypothetical protein